MSVSDELRKIIAVGRPLVEQAIDLAEEFTAVREAARLKGIDWSQAKALLKAQIMDERDGGHRAAKLVEKAEFATEYADILGIGQKMNEENISREASGTDLASAAESIVKSAAKRVIAEDTGIPRFLKRGDPDCYVQSDLTNLAAG